MPPLPGDYAELHLHTAYSFLDGASVPEELVDRAVALGYRSLAITDHDGRHGEMEFARLAHAAGITPLIGAELTIADGDPDDPDNPDGHLTLLAQTPAGYANLCRLITAAHHQGAAVSPNSSYPPLPPWSPGPLTRGAGGLGGSLVPADDRRPRLDPALLPAHAGGLILLTGCRRGRLSRLVDADRLPEAERLLRYYGESFGPANVAVELQHNLVHGDTRRVARLVALAERVGVAAVATGNVHYHRPERHRLQDVLVAIRHRATLDATHRERRPNAEFHLRAPEEMATRFARYPQAIRASVEIAERCAGFDLCRDLAYTFPQHPSGGDSPERVLADVCRAALPDRYPENREAAETRLAEELALIAKHKLAGFFLLYRDLLRLAQEVAVELRGTESARAKAHLPPGRGRGSSVGSIVCYLIGLSPVDPLAHGLFLGRFLNEDLAAVPDIDIDFPREIRERLIARVYAEYGRDRAAMVCAFSTYRLRSAVRDVGKALGLPAPDLDRIAKLSEPRSARELDQELARIPEYAERKNAPPWKHLVEIADQLAGFPRHVTQHSGGMVIASQPLTDLVPIQPTAMEGRAVVQWDKDSCDDARFVKIDFLALGMLSLVEECLELIAAAGHDPVDLSRLDFGDARVYDMICAGDTVGTFQIESRAQIQTLLRTRPRCLEDLVVQVAIVRPGPILGGAVNPYVKGREALRRDPNYVPTYDHPSLEPILRETLGVVLYQEQVLQVAMALAGFTAGQADQLRRAMSRKRSREAMVRLWDQFRDGARALGVDPKTTHGVFKQLMGFASYGFPKAHAAAFAVLAYQSCWLKQRFPAEFACALLNNQPMGFYPPHVLTNDAKRHGLRVLPPDLNQSAARCSVEGGAIRIGLGYVDGLGEEAALRIERERAAGGDFRSLADLVRRVPLRLEAAERLVAVGAADRFGLGRREALWQLGLFLPVKRFGSARTQTETGKQLPLALPTAQDMVGVTLSPMGPWEQMVTDYATLGLSPRYHPLGLLRAHLPPRLSTIADLERVPDGAPVRVAGLVVCRQRPGTAKGITFLLLEDEFGLLNVIVYPALYEEQRLIVRAEPFLLVEGTFQRRDRNLNLIAHRLHRLEAAHAPTGPLGQIPAPREIDVVAAGRGPQGDDPSDLQQRNGRGHDLRLVAPAAHNYR